MAAVVVGQPEAGSPEPIEEKEAHDANAPDHVCPRCGTRLRTSAGGAKRREKVDLAALMMDPEARFATRVKMLAAIPGVDRNAAKAILAVYPTFAAILEADFEELASVRVTKHTELAGRAQAVRWALE